MVLTVKYSMTFTKSRQSKNSFIPRPHEDKESLFLRNRLNKTAVRISIILSGKLHLIFLILNYLMAVVKQPTPRSFSLKVADSNRLRPAKFLTWKPSVGRHLFEKDAYCQFIGEGKTKRWKIKTWGCTTVSDTTKQARLKHHHRSRSNSVNVKELISLLWESEVMCHLTNHYQVRWCNVSIAQVKLIVTGLMKLVCHIYCSPMEYLEYTLQIVDYSEQANFWFYSVHICITKRVQAHLNIKRWNRTTIPIGFASSQKTDRIIKFRISDRCLVYLEFIRHFGTDMLVSPLYRVRPACVYACMRSCVADDTHFR